MRKGRAINHSASGRIYHRAAHNHEAMYVEEVDAKGLLRTAYGPLPKGLQCGLEAPCRGV